MSSASFRIGPIEVGNEHPPVVIAEAGVHHGNSVELAETLISRAAAAGAHAIKFQTYRASRLATKWAPTYWDSGDGKTQYDIFAKRSLLTRDDYARLFRCAEDNRIVFLSTPFDVESAAMLHEFGMAAFKIASADLTNVPLLRAAAGCGVPMLLSTGASMFNEIHEAVRLMRGFDVPIALLHCSLSYPTPVRDANLERIRRLGDEFGDLVIGYSDHTQPQDSELTCPLAVALGARVIEKHYTLDKSLPDDDHYHAVDQDGLIRLVRGCAQAFEMTSSYREMTEAERSARTFARRSIVAARSIAAGQVIFAADVDCKRPGTGISPTQIDDVVGKRATRAFAEDELIEMTGLA
jgi:sialic acid synthase SpsE